MTTPRRHPLIRAVSDLFIGPDATSDELLCGWGSAFLASLAQLAWALLFADWTPLQTAVAVLFAFDIGGGVVVNATRSGRRWWHRDSVTRTQEFAFYVAHVHPFVVSWLWPEYGLGQAAVLYSSMLGFALIVVLAAPGSLKRPVAYGLTAVGIVIGATFLKAPAGLLWLPLLYYMKLIAAHAVSDE
jgi:hypothetical protein